MDIYNITGGYQNSENFVTPKSKILEVIKNRRFLEPKKIENFFGGEGD